MEAQAHALRSDPRVFIYGQDVGAFGGAFKATKNLQKEFPGRVLDSPISEDAMVGSAVGAAIEGSFLNTDGFPIVTKEAGPIDVPANVKYRNVPGKLEYPPPSRLNAFLRAGYFTENRINGKVGEVNDTKWTTVSGGVRVNG